MAGPDPRGRRNPARARRNESALRHGAMSHHSAVRHGEVRLPAIIAVALAGVLHARLPAALLFEPRWVLPAFEIAVLVALTLVNPTRLTRETRFSRVAATTLAGVIIVTNTASLGFLLHDLITAHGSGRSLLAAAFEVWATNIIAFALVFWELDRGGPVARGPSADVPERRWDLMFPQDADPHVAELTMGSPDARWIPVFADYLYLSVTNSTAFSPTDTMPLSTRAKALMTFQAIAALVLSLLVVARAVNILT